MTEKWRRLSRLMLACLLLGSMVLISCKSEPAKVIYPGVVDPLEGPVLMRLAGEEVWEPVEERAFLDIGDSVRTAAGGRAVLFFLDGSRMILTPRSQATVMRFEAGDDYRIAGLWVARGRVVYDIHSADLELSAFQLISAGGVVTVHGTKGVFQALPEDGRITHVLSEGKPGDVTFAAVTEQGVTLVEQPQDSQVQAPLSADEDTFAKLPSAALLGFADSQGQLNFGGNKDDNLGLAGEAVEGKLGGHPHGQAILNGFINWGWSMEPDAESGAPGIQPGEVSQPIEYPDRDLIGEAIAGHLGETFGPGKIQKLTAAAMGETLGPDPNGFFDITYQLSVGSGAPQLAQLAGLPAPPEFSGLARAKGPFFAATRFARITATDDGSVELWRPTHPMYQIVTPTPAPTRSTLSAALAGTWSACPNSSIAPVCEEALGPLATAYLQSGCAVGDACGSFVSGAFESQVVIYRLTLDTMAGGVAYMTAESVLNPSLDTTAQLWRSGPELVVSLASGGYYELGPGCDPYIQAATGCWEYIP